MNIKESQIIGELVAQDYRAAEVFAKYGIDFCCKGGISLKAASEKKNIDLGALLRDLNEITRPGEKIQNDYQAWPMDLLADYIEKKHHRYVNEKTPVILQYLTRVVQVHGKGHPELAQILEHFTASSHALAAHMKKEELVLFPFIRKMAVAKENETLTPYFGTVENPIAMMKEEHEAEGDRFENISQLSNSYTPPAEACNTWRVSYSLLKEFEEDLHMHIHLENNILFPRAIEAEMLMNQDSCRIN